MSHKQKKSEALAGNIFTVSFSSTWYKLDIEKWLGCGTD